MSIAINKLKQIDKAPIKSVCVEDLPTLPRIVRQILSQNPDVATALATLKKRQISEGAIGGLALAGIVLCILTGLFGLIAFAVALALLVPAGNYDNQLEEQNAALAATLNDPLLHSNPQLYVLLHNHRDELFADVSNAPLRKDDRKAEFFKDEPKLNAKEALLAARKMVAEDIKRSGVSITFKGRTYPDAAEIADIQAHKMQPSHVVDRLVADLQADGLSEEMITKILANSHQGVVTNALDPLSQRLAKIENCPYMFGQDIRAPRPAQIAIQRSGDDVLVSAECLLTLGEFKPDVTEAQKIAFNATMLINLTTDTVDCTFEELGTAEAVLARAQQAQFTLLDAQLAPHSEALLTSDRRELEPSSKSRLALFTDLRKDFANGHVVRFRGVDYRSAEALLSALEGNFTADEIDRILENVHLGYGAHIAEVLSARIRAIDPQFMSEDLPNEASFIEIIEEDGMIVLKPKEHQTCFYDTRKGRLANQLPANVYMLAPEQEIYILPSGQMFSKVTFAN